MVLPLLIVACGPAASPEHFGAAYLRAFCALRERCGSGDADDYEVCLDAYAVTFEDYRREECGTFDAAAARACLDQVAEGCDASPRPCDGVCDWEP